MKAIIKQKPEHGGLELCDVPMPNVGDDDVLIKIIKTAICGTDLHIYEWNDWAAKTINTPMIIGHEFVGVIDSVGRNVKGFKPGMLVSGEGHVVCGSCRNCLAGRRHLCKNTKGVGVNRDGVFAEYTAIPASNIWICDEKIPTDILCCFDPLGNAIHSCLTFDVTGEDVLITGAGPIGIMCAAIVRHIGARNVVVTDINPFRLELAKKMGATEIVDVRSQDLRDVMKKLKMTEGFDVGLEMSGSSAALKQMTENMFHGGKIALLGIPDGQIAVDWNKVIFGMLTIKGIYGREMYETWYKMTALIQSGLDISSVITHRFHYTEFEKGFSAMANGQSAKVILNWE